MPPAPSLALEAIPVGESGLQTFERLGHAVHALFDDGEETRQYRFAGSSRLALIASRAL